MRWGRGEASTVGLGGAGWLGFAEATHLAAFLHPQTWQFRLTLGLRSKAGSQRSPAPLGLRRCCPCWDVEGTSSQLSWELMSAFCLLQGKGRRESEDPRSCRRPSGQSPTSAEKRMSFESISSLPEVSGQQAERG